MSGINENATWDSAAEVCDTKTEAASLRAAQGMAEQTQGAAPCLQPVPCKEETEYTKRLKRQFGFFAPATLLYAAFYAFCMFKNSSGITFPFFVAGSLLYLCFCLSKLEISLKKGSIFYMIGMMLLAVSTFCTDDLKIINLNKTAIFLLMMSLLLQQFFNTAGWKLGKYLGSMALLVFGSLGEIGRPFADGAAYRREKGGKERKKVWSAILGAAIGVPLMLVVAGLLGSADALFRQMTDKFFDWIQPDNIFNVLLRIAFLFFASYLLLSYLCRQKISEKVKDRRKGEPVLAITITGFLTLLYLLFSVIQVFGLFLGKMQLPEGYTYAEYAREGFFQLLAVSILNLVLVLLAMNYFRESKLLKGILTVMSFCTFIMISSSAMRMIIYIRYYYLTFLRIFVLWTLAVLFFLFAGVIISIFREKFPLFGYSAAVVTVFYLALSFSHPDYLIARVNVANAPQSVAEAEEMQKIKFSGEEFYQEDFFVGGYYRDYNYLSTLSADAAPVLIPYLDQMGYDLQRYQEEDILDAANPEWSARYTAEGFGWYYLDRIKYRLDRFSPRTYNISRHMALRKIGAYMQ